MSKILIPYNSIVHSNETDNQIDTIVKKIKQVFKNQEITIDLLLPGNLINKIECVFSKIYPFRDIYLLSSHDGSVPEYKQYINKICQIAKTQQYTHIFIPSGMCSKPISANLSVSLQAGVTVDVIDFYYDDNGKLSYIRATSSNELLAFVQCNGLPEIATLKLTRSSVSNLLGTMQPTQSREYVIKEICLEESDQRSNIFFNDESDRLNEKDIVIGVGRGVSNKTLDRIIDFANRHHICVMATKPNVENGAFDYSRQVGQSGCSINSKLYIAVGIAGAMQHIVGILGCKIIIAVNPDKNAPIHDYADISIISKAEDIF